MDTLWPFVLGALLLGAAFLALHMDVRQWEAFKREHSCQVVGYMTGDIFTTVGPAIGSNGGVAVGIGSTPSKTGWKCDDGMTYWR